MVVDTRNLRSYFRLLEDNRIMFGARGGISDTAASRGNDEGLAADPAREAVSRSWRHRRRLFLARLGGHPARQGAAYPCGRQRQRGLLAGLYGNGGRHSTHAGKLLADSLATERRPDVPALVGAPLPRYEIPALRKLYQRAAYSYFYLKDEFL